MATQDEFQALTARVTELEATTQQLLEVLSQVQSALAPLASISTARGNNHATKARASDPSSFFAPNPSKTTTLSVRDTDNAAQRPSLSGASSGSSHSAGLLGAAAWSSKPNLFGSTANASTGLFGSSAPFFALDQPAAGQEQPRPSASGAPFTVTFTDTFTDRTSYVSPPTQSGKATIASNQPLLIDRYRYQELNAEQSQVRLLAVRKSDKFNAPVVARTIIESLDALDASRLARNPIGTTDSLLRGSGASGFGYGSSLRDAGTPAHHPFSALSYTWGHGDSHKDIYVDNQVLKVTESLEVALRYIRNMDANQQPAKHSSAAQSSTVGETLWWIDAICINQDDTGEKNIQVGQMTRLFKHASQVHVWLGEAADDSDLALELIQQIGYSPSNTQEREDWLYIRRGDETHRQAGPGETLRKLPDEPHIRDDQKHRNAAALRNLFGRPWFQRVWVRQEIALPPKITVRCGSQSCDWEELARAASVINYLSTHVDYNPLSTSKSQLTAPFWIGAPSGVQQMVELGILRHRTGRERKRFVPFANLLVHAKQCQATDARDMVFSMLGLADPSYVQLKPDYNANANQIWTEAVLQLLPISLDFLGACHYVEGSNDLPSWVPDLGCAWRRVPFRCPKRMQENIDLPESCLAGGTVPKYNLHRDRMMLQIEGWYIDSIQDVCPKLVLPDMTLNDVHELKTNWVAWLQERFCPEATDNWFNSLLNQIYRADYKELDFYENGYFTPLEDRPLHQDPTFRRAARLLLPIGMYKIEQAIDPSIITLRTYGRGRKLMCTTSGQYGLVPNDAKAGDHIVVFPGCTWAHCLRKRSADEFLVMGEAAVQFLLHLPGRWMIPENHRQINLV